MARAALRPRTAKTGPPLPFAGLAEGAPPRPAARRPRRRLPLALALALPTLAGGCALHRGASWVRGAALASDHAEAEPGVSLLVLGAPAPGRAAAQVAERLAALRDAELASGRAVAVIWTGDNVFPAGLAPAAETGPARGASERDADDCLESGQAWSRRGLRELAAAAGPPSDPGAFSGQFAGSWATLGRRDWRCGAPEPQLGAPPPGQPYAIFDHHFVVRIDPEGRTTLRSRCAGDHCALEEAPVARPGTVELVFVDQTPWVFPPEDPGRGVRVGELRRQTDSLLAGLGPTPPEITRLLVTQVAVESAGAGGQGGTRAAATVHRVHPAVRDAVTRGELRGVIAGLDRSLQLLPDLDPAMQRVAKRWIERPVFQVISGAAGRPDGRWWGAPGRGPWSRSFGVAPAAHSTHPGLALVRVTAGEVVLELHARRAGAWEVAREVLPRVPDPLPRARPAPPMAPCLRCDPRQSPANR